MINVNYRERNLVTISRAKKLKNKKKKNNNNNHFYFVRIMPAGEKTFGQ